MAAITAFEVVAEDVQAAALTLGHEIGMGEADDLMEKLTREDLLSAEKAALGAVRMDAQADLAVARIAELLQERGLVSPARSPLLG